MTCTYSDKPKKRDWQKQETEVHDLKGACSDNGHAQST